MLMADGGIGEIDFKVDPQRISGRDRRRSVAVLHGHGFQHLKSHYRGRKLAQTALHDATHEGQRRTIEDRHFGAVDLNQKVMDATASNGRHQMLNGRDRQASGVFQLGAERRAVHRVPAGGDQSVAHGHIAAREPDAMVGGGRAQSHRRRLTGVQACARKTYC